MAGLCAGLLAGGTLGLLPAPGRQVPRPGQVQVAGRFLQAVLRANYAGAYARLAPEVRQAVSYARFTTLARPLWKAGQRRGQAIELYKLGVRLGDHGAGRLFYAYSFAAEAQLNTPTVLLEVTFRDTASRAVLGFGLRPRPAPKPGRQGPRSAP